MENRCSNGFNDYQLVWTISLYLPMLRAMWCRKPISQFTNDMADSIGKYTDPCRRNTERFFQFWLLCRFRFSRFSGGTLCCQVGLDKMGNQRHSRCYQLWWCSCCPLPFIAHAPDYIKKINEFHQTSVPLLDLGTKSCPQPDSEGKDSVDLIRQPFSIQAQ